MKRFNLKSALAVLMSAVMLMSFAACGDKNKDNEPDLTPGVEQGGEDKEKVEPKKLASEAKKKNNDVIGWLYVPGTTINEAVCYSKDNKQYYRNDLEGEWDYLGTYFIDMDNVGTKEGTRAKLDKHTVIYGHSIYDGDVSPRRMDYFKRYGVPENLIKSVRDGGIDYKDGEKFAQLFKYVDRSFAKEHPYIYFSSDKEEMVWEIFAVYYSNIATGFNRWNAYETMATPEGMMNVVADSKAKSLHDFGVDVKKDDNILTLSTCSYIEGPNNHNIRFHVAARLVKPGEELKKEAKVSENKNKVNYASKVKLAPVKEMIRK